MSPTSKSKWSERAVALSASMPSLSVRLKEEATLDRYIDHIEHVRDLIGVNGVAIGFDFFEFIFRQWPPAEQIEFQKKFTHAHFVPDLAKHSHSRGLTRRLIERGFNDGEIEAILFRNWMRIFQQWL